MSTFTERVVGAARLDVHVYEEVEADRTAMGQAMAVVVLSSIAAGVGSGLTLGSLLAGAIGALIGWFIWAFLTYLIGTKLLPQPQTRADAGELLRTIGFSASPGLLRVFGLVPLLGGLIVLIAEVWMLVAMVIAVRQALDYTSTWRAVGVCVVGWLVLVAITLVIGGGILGLAG
ncbi:MAG: hypothetical protein GTN62_02235 [Gemmatimonadales bacterium]|nr:hypothetical protein [Gemmatimonadales bacterium]NIN12380.1 hypothetical protein [Gemmatimonadales bacterium]NIN48918.1 hypothetical protein [Gemmatimonadales bacterium]NIP06382.1 hypothetical protein [Gemmatimonadales bacterium]NIR00755.1 hypothetical protein [Gemmatimonadales bacterium]